MVGTSLVFQPRRQFCAQRDALVEMSVEPVVEPPIAPAIAPGGTTEAVPR
jgi:hypothetical protein